MYLKNDVDFMDVNASIKQKCKIEVVKELIKTVLEAEENIMLFQVQAGVNYSNNNFNI